jgi:hypothetical protein
VTGSELVAAMLRRGAARPPYVPIVGEFAAELGQVPFEVYVGDAQAQAVALAQTVQAMQADAATVGIGTDPAVGCDVLRRLRPLLSGQGIAAVVSEADVAAARAYCEEGAQLLLLLAPEAGGRLKTLGNACRFYEVATILVDHVLEDAVAVALAYGLSGAVVAHPTGVEPGIVGGGLSVEHLVAAPVAPRAQGFFWSFPGEVPAGTSPEGLAELGAKLTG